MMAPLGEVQFVQGVAAQFASNRYGPLRACAGIVGTADLAKYGAGIGPLLVACKQQSPNYRGIRCVTTRRRPRPTSGRTRACTATPHFAKVLRCCTSTGSRSMPGASPPNSRTCWTWPARDEHCPRPHRDAACRARQPPQRRGTRVRRAAGCGPRRVEGTHGRRRRMPECGRQDRGSCASTGTRTDQRETPASSEELAKLFGPLYLWVIETFGAARSVRVQFSRG